MTAVGRLLPAENKNHHHLTDRLPVRSSHVGVI
jgi:hypothetical protein